MSTLRINLGPTAGTDGSGARRANRLPALLSPAGKGPENMRLPLLRGPARGHTRATAEEKQMRLTHAETAAGLRKLADIMDANPGMVNPFGGSTQTIYLSCFTAEEFAVTVKAFGRGKKADNIANDSIDFTPDLLLPIKVFGHKRWICEARTVTRAVPRRVIPGKPAVDERVIDEHEETVTEYTCHPILAALSDSEGPEASHVPNRS